VLCYGDSCRRPGESGTVEDDGALALLGEETRKEPPHPAQIGGGRGGTEGRLEHSDLHAPLRASGKGRGAFFCF
jgi:hypothetical protein